MQIKKEAFDNSAQLYKTKAADILRLFVLWNFILINTLFDFSLK